MARSTHQIVDRQIQRWHHEARASRPQPRKPCIAFSRRPFSGASELAERVAQRLGYGFFGIELVDEIAREQHVGGRLVEGLDEHVRSAIERHVVDAFHRSSLLESEYLRALVHVITAMGERGGAVVLGRGAPYVLGPDRALRVFVVAPPEMRAERLAKMRGIDASEAMRALRREDTDRAAFLRHHFRVDPDDPVLYDLVVNTGTLSIDAAADLIIAALERRFPTTP